MNDDYFTANRRNWDERAPIHASSSSYDLAAFRDDPTHLSGVVRFDQRYLGDLSGRQAVHLQCHIGTDTLSLARLGATVTGLDQSPQSIAEARRLFAAAATPGRFEIANVYDAPRVLGRRYDLVYTGVGAINWLPDIDRWAQTVADLLAPGGRLYLREGHPMLSTLADITDPDDLTLKLRYPYFETEQPIVFDQAGTYTGDEVTLTHTRTYEWNHGLGEIVTALLKRGLTLRTLHEHDGLEWKMFPHMVFEDGQYKLPPEQRPLVPMMFTLIAERPAA